MEYFIFHTLNWFFCSFTSQTDRHMYRKIATIVIFILMGEGVQAQNKTYSKEIFPLLETKNYATASPLLKEYLSDPKHGEEASPLYQFGLIIEDRFFELDIVDDTLRMEATGDSAINYFNLAKNLIDEKELKKNGEFWQAFNRRDLRTGEFGVKLSDVHLDIENQVEKIENRQKAVKDFHMEVKKTRSRLASLKETYLALTMPFDDYNVMLIRADEETNAKLDQLVADASFVEGQVEKINGLADDLDSEAFSTPLKKMPIEVFKEDGTVLPPIVNGSFEMWDYGAWASEAKNEINTTVASFREAVKTYGEKLKAVKQSLKSGSRVDIPEVPEALVRQFDTYDPGSATLNLMKLEQAEATILANTDPILNPALSDSGNVMAQYTSYKVAKQSAEDLNRHSESMDILAVDEASSLYPAYLGSFESEYGTATNYVSAMKKWSLQKKVAFEDALRYWEGRNNWGITETDSIALFVQESPESGWITRGVPVKDENQVITYGMSVADSVGAVFGFGKDRRGLWRIDFDTPGITSPSLKYDTMASPKGSLSIFVFNEEVDENNLSMLSFTKSGAKNWKAVTTVDRAPVSFKFDDLTQELTVLFYPEGELPLDPDNPGYLVVDYAGNIR